MVRPEVVTAATAAAAWMAWAVRGRSARVFGDSVWRGPATRRAVALTFDDGPSESTPAILEELARWNAVATFFHCGSHVRRLPHIARAVLEAGHEIGNHTENHAALWLRGRAFLRDEIGQAQRSIEEITGARPRWFRAPYGVRWPGLGAVQREFGLTGAMWTVIARDWAVDGPAVAARLIRGASPGGIFCLHDGRALQRNPDIRSTVEGLRTALPQLRDAGYAFVRLSDLIG